MSTFYNVDTVWRLKKYCPKSIRIENEIDIRDKGPRKYIICFITGNIRKYGSNVNDNSTELL